MKKFGFSLFFAALALIAGACSNSTDTVKKTYGHDGRVQRTMTLKEFAGLDVSTGIRVEYTRTDDATYRLTADYPASVGDNLVTEVKGDRLEIYCKGNNNIDVSSGGIVVRVTGPDLAGIACSAGAGVELMAGMRSPGSLKVSISSGSCLIWEKPVEVKKDFELTASSGAKVRGGSVSGKRFRSVASSGANVDCAALHFDEACFETSSGAAVNCPALSAGSFAASASSSARLTVGGRCEAADFSASSGSQIRAGGLKAGKASATASSSGTVYAPRTEQLSRSESSGGSVR